MSSDKMALWWVIGLGALALLWWYATGFVRDVATSVEKWSPPTTPCSEAQLRSSLAAHLRRTLPAATAVIEEFGSERSKVDIVVLSSQAPSNDYVERVAIELKHRLSSKTDLDRLVGQIVGYRTQQFDRVMIVSVAPDPNLHEVLKRRAETKGLSGFMMVLAK